jgi:hypothetical protein
MHVAHPLGGNNREHLIALFRRILSERDMLIATHSNGAPHSETPSSLTLTVNILTPEIRNGKFPYRKYVKARVSLSGNAPLPIDGVVLGPAHSNEPQVVRTLRLWCYAECRSCTSPGASAHQRCNPTGFYLIPVRDGRHNQAFVPGQSGGLSTLTSNVKYEIKHRPRKPSAEDWEWRCPTESLM